MARKLRSGLTKAVTEHQHNDDVTDSSKNFCEKDAVESDEEEEDDDDNEDEEDDAEVDESNDDEEDEDEDNDDDEGVP
jgi:hypothetical protein